MNDKMVSVVMPSYNSDKEMLEEAVKSILNQTYRNLELVIIDDGSVTPIEEILNIKDNRLHIVRNDANRGIVYSLNRGLELAKGDYIARMDADDISDHMRIKMEVDFLDIHKEVDVVSTYAKTFGVKNTIYKSETTPEGIKAELLWKNIIIHPTVMLRASLIKAESIRYSINSKSEDFDLWSRIVYEFNKKIAVIPKPLLFYRIHDGQITKMRADQLKNDEERIIHNNMGIMGVELDTSEYYLYTKARNGEKLAWSEISGLLNVFRKILGQVHNQEIKHVLRKRYFKEILKTLIKRLYA